MKVVALISLLIVIPLTSLAAQPKSAGLAGVKKIYIDSTQSGEPDQTESLTRELTKVGFDVVTVRSQADAKLTVFAQIQVVVDGDGSDPNKSFFTYELALPDKTVVWKHKISMVMRTVTDDVNYGAAKMAAKLLKDKDAAVRRVAHK